MDIFDEACDRCLPLSGETGLGWTGRAVDMTGVDVKGRA